MSERDLFELTELSRFSVLPRPLIHVQGDPQTLEPLERLEDPWATARKHPSLPTINEAAYVGEIIRHRVGQALELMNKAPRTAEEENQLHKTGKSLKAVATALRKRKLYPRLAPADKYWSDDAQPAALVEMWMAVLPQIKKTVEAKVGKKVPGIDMVRDVIGRCEYRPWPNVTMYSSTVDDMLKVQRVLAKNNAPEAILSYCRKKIAPRIAAFRVVAQILETSEAAVRHARNRHSKSRPGKRSQK